MFIIRSNGSPALAHQKIFDNEAIRKSKRLKFDAGQPIVDRSYLEWTELVTSAIAHGIAEDVVRGIVVVRKSNNAILGK